MEVDGRQYQAGEDMDARVKRLEAECEQLRGALRETRERIAPYINIGTIKHGFDLLVKIDKALAPPESEPNGDDAREDIWMVERGMIPRWASKYTAPHTPEYAVVEKLDADMQKVLHRNRRRNYLSSGPEQTGDALAALEALKSHARFGEYDDPDIHEANLNHWARTIRQTLTASGVPYVPESIRALPAEWRACVDQYGAHLSEVAANQRGVYRKCAEELERALASAPADANNANVTCECERGPREIVENTDEGGTKWWTLATHCTDCLESAAAPTDGREYE